MLRKPTSLSKQEKENKMNNAVYVPHIIANDGSITVFADGESLVFASDCPKITDVKEALKVGDTVKLKELAKPAVVIDNYLKGSKANNTAQKKVTIVDGTIMYGEEILDNGCTQRILNLQAESLPFEPFILFLEKLMNNPSFKSRKEAYEFLAHAGMPICSDGDFIAYRKVTQGFLDFHTRTIDNSVGAKPKMDRRDVDDRSEVVCSKGYHICALTYARDHFMPGQGRIVVVKVNPADIVSIPTDYSQTKARCTGFEVIEEYKGSIMPETYYDYNDSWNDDRDNDEDWEEEDWSEECEECGEDLDNCDCEL